MTEREIKRIRRKFIWTSTVSFFGVMLLMAVFIYTFSTFTLRNEVKQIMRYIAENDGELPAMTPSGHGAASSEESSGEESSFNERMEWDLKDIFGVGDLFGESPDYLYTTRFFSVLFDGSGELVDVKMTHLAYLDEDRAIQYAGIALGRFRKFGNFGRYYYYVGERADGGNIVIYLDRTAQIASINRVVFASLSLIGMGTVLAFFVLRLFSGNIVKSEMKNIEKQKQFITNASHELKTPLSVIRANTEMLELEGGESEWTRSTMRQVDRMDGLIQNLVKVSRAEENVGGRLTDLNIASIVRETAEAMKPVAEKDGKKMSLDIPETLKKKCDEGKLRQLTSLLTDNAVKYCDEGGSIEIKLQSASRKTILTVSNDYAAGKDVDYDRFFERFYREDAAHTSGGYGIGLSVVSEIMKQLKGSVDVRWKDGRISFTCRF